ncbi:MAG: ribosome silencing factor [Nitrosomonas sp.]|nr:ribosome silencing factor [Nitrosomonas sp.]MBP6074861.1 ribosome silencing factor [Nitrosomonas sp.]
MNPEKLVNTIVDALEDIKAYDIDVIDVSKITALFGYIIIASADSTRQTKSLANNVQEKVKAAGGRVYSVEGEQTGEWLLVDLGDVIVHIMLPVAREYYNLKALWSGKN